jgi:hypothetical protein
MVRSLLIGRKTQTRRVVKGAPPAGTTDFIRYHHPDDELGARPFFWAWGADPDHPDAECILDFALPCPYGAPGDLLWVRETWARHADGVTYRADFDETSFAATGGIAWRPSIHMPRALARITLRITEVRVEQLQRITEADARCEGVDEIRARVPTCRDAYRLLWDDIHGAGAWDGNPWVWVVAFERARELPA